MKRLKRRKYVLDVIIYCFLSIRLNMLEEQSILLHRIGCVSTKSVHSGVSLDISSGII